MSKSVITDALLTDIADAIRAKAGTQASMTPAQMAQAIEDIPQGGREPYVEYTLENGNTGHITGAQLKGFEAVPHFFAYRSSGNGHLTSVEIPEGVLAVGVHAFENSGLQTISLPDSLTGIDDYSFAGCGFSEINLPDGLEVIGQYAFQNCKNLESIVIPEGIHSVVSADLFSGCVVLKSVNFPPAWTYIAEYCFNGCKALELTSIPAHITAIGSYAFRSCESITELDILGAAYTNSDAFYKCTGLRVVKFHATPSRLHATTFESDTALTDIYVPWSSGAVAGAPWGAKNASIHYDTQYDSNGNVIS